MLKSILYWNAVFVALEGGGSCFINYIMIFYENKLFSTQTEAKRRVNLSKSLLSDNSLCHAVRNGKCNLEIHIYVAIVTDIFLYIKPSINTKESIKLETTLPQIPKMLKLHCRLKHRVKIQQMRKIIS